MSDVGVVLIGVLATAGGLTVVGWMSWVSVTLVKILGGIVGHDERLDDHERRLGSGGL